MQSKLRHERVKYIKYKAHCVSDHKYRVSSVITVLCVVEGGGGKKEGENETIISYSSLVWGSFFFFFNS